VPIVQPAAAAGESSAPTTWLTVAEAAKHTQVSARTIYFAVRAGTLRHARVGGRRSLRFRPDWVDAWLTAENTPTEVPRGTTFRVAR
jgi:excisionase family DNA binding protein